MDKIINVLGKVQSGRVVIFSKSYCPYCDRAKELFEKMQVKYEAIECDIQSVKSEDLDKLSTMCLGTKTFPKIFIGKTAIGGCDALTSSIRKGAVWEILDNEKITYSKFSL